MDWIHEIARACGWFVLPANHLPPAPCLTVRKDGLRAGDPSAFQVAKSGFVPRLLLAGPMAEGAAWQPPQYPSHPGGNRGAAAALAASWGGRELRGSCKNGVSVREKLHLPSHRKSPHSAEKMVSSVFRAVLHALKIGGLCFWGLQWKLQEGEHFQGGF